MNEANEHGQVWFTELEEAVNFFEKWGAVEMRYASDPLDTYFFFNSKGHEVGHYIPMFRGNDYLASGHLFRIPREWHPSFLGAEALDVYTIEGKGLRCVKWGEGE